MLSAAWKVVKESTNRFTITYPKYTWEMTIMNRTATDWLRGRCLCGAVEYSVKDAFLYAGYCHCGECRKFSGSACSANAGVEEGDFRIEKGFEEIKVYKKTEASILNFCSQCGSSLYVQKPQWGRVHVRMGTLLDEPTIRPTSHYFVGSKAEWEIINDDLPHYVAAPPRD